MAEGFAKEENKKRGTQYTIESAGINAFDKDSPSENAVEAMKNYDIDISKHQAKKIGADDVKTSDLILTMTESQCLLLKQIFPDCSEKIFSLKNNDISDPYGSDAETYRLCAKEIKDAVEAVFEKLENDRN